MSVTFYSTTHSPLTDENCEICLESLKSDDSIFNIFQNSSKNLEHLCPPQGTVKHTFHADCLTAWFATRSKDGGRPCCPTCKQDAVIEQSLIERVIDVIRTSAGDTLMISASWGAVHVIKNIPPNFWAQPLIKFICYAGKLHQKGITTAFSSLWTTQKRIIELLSSFKTASTSNGIKFFQETFPPSFEIMTKGKQLITSLGKVIQEVHTPHESIMYVVKTTTQKLVSSFETTSISNGIKILQKALPTPIDMFSKGEQLITFLEKAVKDAFTKRGSTAYIAGGAALIVALSITGFQKFLARYSYDWEHHFQRKIFVLPLIYLGFLFLNLEEHSLLSVCSIFFLVSLCTNALAKDARLRYER